MSNDLNSLDIRDDTGALADAMVDKYLADAEMGNFTSMTPGLTDVKAFDLKSFTSKLEFKLDRCAAFYF